VKALTFYKDFFNVPYPLKKYDMIAIPDFSSGAMENWGLVTYREACILVDPVNTSASSKVDPGVFILASIFKSTQPSPRNWGLYYYSSHFLSGFNDVEILSNQNFQFKLIKNIL
jgi:hypothetical protein